MYRRDPEPDRALLDLLDRYLDTAPRAASRVEEVGPFNLFVGTGPWRYYARPRPGLGEGITVGEVVAVMSRQRELGVPQALEWIVQTAPGLDAATTTAGLRTELRPLLALQGEPRQVHVDGVIVRALEADDPALADTLRAIDVSFGGDGARTSERAAHSRQEIEAGRTIVVAATDPDGRALAGGSVLPRGEIAELVGIATLAQWRGRGIGAAVTATLAHAARARGVRTAMLSAGDDRATRVYERVGFERVGSVGDALAPA